MTTKWEDEILASSPADLVERNGGDLLALHLQNVIRDSRKALQNYRESLRLYTDDNRRGLLIYRAAKIAERNGRKTLRVADVLALGDDT